MQYLPLGIRTRTAILTYTNDVLLLDEKKDPESYWKIFGSLNKIRKRRQNKLLTKF